MSNREKKIKIVLDRSRKFGLSQMDFEAVEEFLKYKEYGLALDTIITQLYEYDICIDEPLYFLIEEVAKEMRIIAIDYICLKELIRG